MTLSLTRRPGERVFANDRPYEIVAIASADHAVVRYHNGMLVDVYRDRTTSINPKVRVYLSDNQSHNKESLRLVFDADADVEVLREEIYVKKYATPPKVARQRLCIVRREAIAH